MNRDELFSDQYKKSLANEMRAAFGYEGCPVVLVPKARPKTIEPMRKFKQPDGKTSGRPALNSGQKSENRAGSRAGGRTTGKPANKQAGKFLPRRKKNTGARGSNRAKGRR